MINQLTEFKVYKVGGDLVVSVNDLMALFKAIPSVLFSGQGIKHMSDTVIQELSRQIKELEK